MSPSGPRFWDRRLPLLPVVGLALLVAIGGFLTTRALLGDDGASAGDPRADDSSDGSTVTTDAPAEPADQPGSPRDPSLAMDGIWPDSEVDSSDRADPVQTARNFVRDVVGEAPAGAQDTATGAGDPLFSEVDVTLENGVSFFVLLSSTSGGWVVTDVDGRTSYSYSAEPLMLTLNGIGDGVEQADVSWRDTGGVHVESYPVAGLQDGQIPFSVEGSLFNLVVVLRDDGGDVVDVFGIGIEQVTPEPIEP